jgi:hypothetical protein
MSIPIPNPVYLLALDGTTWVPAVDINGIANTTQLSPPPGASAIPYYDLNDATLSNFTWRLCVMPSPSQPAGFSGELHVDPAGTFNPNAPVQLLVSAPNAVVYFLQINNGVLQSGLAIPASASCNVPISVLAQNVLQRLEEDLPPDGPVFWNLQFEIYTGLVEAMSELMLLVGRPTMTVQSPLNLQSNTPWQPMPRGLLALTDIYGSQSLLRKVTLFSLDFEQASWGSDWECDTAASPVRWAPIGFNMFVVHPAANAATQVLINAVAYPAAVPWPYTGAEIVPFTHEFHVLLEEYAAVYARVKEGSSELQAALPMLAEFYAGAKRMTQIADRRDSLIFSNSFGVPAGTNQIQRR